MSNAGKQAFWIRVESGNNLALWLRVTFIRLHICNQ
jgi:hypothetical protein